jgi:hypothetical protein
LSAFDILIPVHMPPEAGFSGESGRGGRVFNGEIAFKFGQWAASFHEMRGRRYFIVRLGLDEDGASKTLPALLARIARASVLLDVSIRPVDGELVVLGSGQRADLKNISLFPAGEMPYVGFGDGSFFVKLPISMLSDALDEEVSESKETALKLFADVDFEATTASRFVVLSTVVELLAERRARDAAALELVDRWIEEAGSASRQDLVQALTPTCGTSRSDPRSPAWFATPHRQRGVPKTSSLRSRSRCGKRTGNAARSSIAAIPFPSRS